MIVLHSELTVEGGNKEDLCRVREILSGEHYVRVAANAPVVRAMVKAIVVLEEVDDPRRRGCSGRIAIALVIGDFDPRTTSAISFVINLSMSTRPVCACQMHSVK